VLTLRVWSLLGEITEAALGTIFFIQEHIGMLSAIEDA
jgi:hypothetical protein